MKYLFYNPIESATKVRIKSKCFGIDIEYSSYEAMDKPVYIDQLFQLSQLEWFDDVQVYLSAHESAYYKNKKSDSKRTKITGWISLKEYKNGGGYLKDSLSLD